MLNNHFPKRLGLGFIGLQFFAEGDGGESGAADSVIDDGAADDSLEADFANALLGEEAASAETTTEEEPEEDPGAEGGEGGEQAADDPASQAGGETEPQQAQAPQMAMLNIGGQSVPVPAQAVQMLNGALGRDVSTLIAAGMAAENRQSREMQLLDAYARAEGVTTDQYLDFLEQQRDAQAVAAEIENIRAQYPEGTPDEALQAIAGRNVADRRAVEVSQRAAAEAERQQAQQSAAIQPAMQAARDFAALHPEIKSAQDVPQGVWEIVKNQQVSLPVAYERYQAEQLRAQNEQLTTQIKAAQKQGTNRAQALGAMSGQQDNGQDVFISTLLS